MNIWLHVYTNIWSYTCIWYIYIYIFANAPTIIYPAHVALAMKRIPKILASFATSPRETYVYNNVYRICIDIWDYFLDALAYFMLDHKPSYGSSEIIRNHQKWPWLAWSLFLASAASNIRPCTQGGQMGQVECTGIGIKPKIKDSKDAKNRAAQHVLGLCISNSASNTPFGCWWLWCGTSRGCLLTQAKKSGDQSTPQKVQKTCLSGSLRYS